MRSILRSYLVLLLLISSQTNLFSQSIPDYYSRSKFLFAPPSVFNHGLLGFSNPANPAFLKKPELHFHFATDGDELFSIKDWGVFAGTGNFGFSVQRQHGDDYGATDFKFSAATGSQAFAMGLGYGWSRTNSRLQNREKLISLGSILRPAKQLSLGLTANLSVESNQREGVAEIGFRPFGRSNLTLFADAAIRNGVKVSDAPWSVGGIVQPASGIYFSARYFESGAFTFGFSFDLSTGGQAAQIHFDKNSDHAFNSYSSKIGGASKLNIFEKKWAAQKHYTAFSLKGRVAYLKYDYLDGGILKFSDILKNIKAAEDDPRIQTIALNLAGLRINPENAWEIRDALSKARFAGKSVLIFIERTGMTGYHLASVADQIALDPQGAIDLKGYAMGTTYFRGALDKLGLGFSEWRFFKYKSANEMFSRDSMSTADREQRQAFIDDLYETTRAEVCARRNLSLQKFDALVDEQSYFLADEALQSGLVDTLLRWSEIDGFIKKYTGKKLKKLPARLLNPKNNSENWGTKPKIAVVYGLGVCAMDSGIKARWLERVFLALANNTAVKAVVFRVDSPGGDGMASDVVAEAIIKCRKQKPVIISQGQMAASGGYWLSMYGDEIFAAPSTLTGSIGVIFGWVYDKGFGKKFGMTSDVVKRGAHADLGAGIRLPFTGLKIPARNLTEDEQKKAEHIIRSHYDAFVRKVARGRELSEERVREIAEGRIYSGTDALAIKLVDRIGGLNSAIERAQEMAGFKDDPTLEIIEIPRKKGLFNLRNQLSPFGFSVNEQTDFELLKFMIEHNGTPTALTWPELYFGLE